MRFHISLCAFIVALSGLGCMGCGDKDRNNAPPPASSSSPPSITTTSLPDGQVGVSYSATVQATGGTLPYTWSISTGALPSGINLDPATGELSGMPTASGSFSFGLRCADSSVPANSATMGLAINVP